MYSIVATGRFKKDLKVIIKRGYDVGLLDEIIRLLSEGKKLPKQNRDHSLFGNYKGYRECHITNDWILIYKIEVDIIVLTLSRTGTHSDLF